MTALIEQIKQLRRESGAGVMECRSALEQANHSYPEALEILNAKAAAAAALRANRETRQGTVEVYSHGQGRIGVMVEVNIETDFAARSAVFRNFAHEVALQIAAASPVYVCEEEIPPEALEEEARKATALARSEGKPEAAAAGIIEGQLRKFKDEKVLLRQASIRDDKTTVAELLSRVSASVGEHILIRRFARWELVEDESE
jgi:elongation factor Ts